ALLARPLEQVEQDVARPRSATALDEPVEGLQPLGGLLGVDVGDLTEQSVDERSCVGRHEYLVSRGSSRWISRCTSGVVPSRPQARVAPARCKAAAGVAVTYSCPTASTPAPQVLHRCCDVADTPLRSPQRHPVGKDT